MSIDEAVLLILQSTVIGTSNLLVLEMGEQIKILDIAEILINLNKIENPNKNIEINFIGLRNGEKMEEDLSYSKLIKTSNEFIFTTA